MLKRLLIVSVVCLWPVSARAQEASHWGAAVSFTPSWSIPTSIGKIFGSDLNVNGSDVSIGVVRGRDFGGDWGVSYIHKTVNDNSMFADISSDFCPTAGNCFASGERSFTRDVAMNGVLVHKYWSFGTIARRVQIGLRLAGGVANVKGSVETHEYNADFAGFDPRTGQTFYRQTETISTRPAAGEVLFSTMPLFDLQPAVSVILAPGVKLRFAGGLDFPGTNVFSMTGVFFLGGGR